MENKIILDELNKIKLLPLYTATDLNVLQDLEEILVEANVPMVEVTFRSNLALPAMKKLSESGKILVGAGTVRTAQEAKQAVENGAKFIVSPAVVDEVICYCNDNDIPVFPGVATPSEIQKAVQYGIHNVKFFPADVYGGLKAIKALSGPFYDVKFLPTGGISDTNFTDYIQNDHILAVGGSFIISEKMIQQKGKDATIEYLKGLTEKVKSL